MGFPAGRVALGLLLVALGALFLLDQAGWIDAGRLIGDWWPLAIIGFGVVQLAERPRSLVGPLIVIGIGAALLVGQLDLVGDNVWNLVWPLALVLIGLAILIRRPSWNVTAGAGNDVVRATAIFGGNDVVSTSQRFRGGSVTAIFGGGVLDLRQATLDPAGATVAATALFGAVDILVPRGWRVETSGLPIFGGYDNNVEPPPPGTDGPTLKVDVLAIFGGAEIKHDK